MLDMKSKWRNLKKKSALALGGLALLSVGLSRISCTRENFYESSNGYVLEVKKDYPFFRINDHYVLEAKDYDKDLKVDKLIYDYYLIDKKEIYDGRTSDSLSPLFPEMSKKLKEKYLEKHPPLGSYNEKELPLILNIFKPNKKIDSCLAADSTFFEKILDLEHKKYLSASRFSDETQNVCGNYGGK